jgi:hypothetical protein
MKSFKDVLNEISKATLNKYLDKSAEERKELIAQDNLDKLKKRQSGASLAITKVMGKMGKESSELNK